MNTHNLTKFNLLIILTLSISLLTNAHPELRSKDPETPLALLSLQTKAFIQSGYAEIQYIQKYQNLYPHPLEAEFYSPQTENTIFHKFEAVFQNQTIVGKIFEKRKAQRFYSWNQELISKNLASSNQNVTKVHIGHVPAYETVEIKFSVLQPLGIILNQFWNLTLDAPSSEYFQYSFCQEWDIEVEIKSNQPFNYINNPTHYIKPDLFEPSPDFYKAVWNATLPLKESFVVHWRLDNIEYPNTILATHPNYPDDHVLFFNFIPQLAKLVNPGLLEEGERGILELRNQVIEEDLRNVRTEFIFLVHLSSSLEPKKTIKLREILEEFLLILPKNSRFNLLSFDQSSSFHPAKSLPLSSENLQKAFAWIATLNSDTISAEGLHAFKQLMSAPQIQGYPRTIILLTDREKLSSLETIPYIGQYSNEVRIYPIGIEEKVIPFMRNILSQSLEKIELKTECFDSQEKLFFTDNKKQRILFKDKLFKKWIYLRNTPDLDYCNITIRYFNSFKQENILQALKINGSKMTSTWHKIAYDSKINNENSLISEAIKFSTRYQILSKLVSFLPVIIGNQEYSQDISIKEIEKKFITIISADKTSFSDHFSKTELQEEPSKQTQRDYFIAHPKRVIPIFTFDLRSLRCLVGCFGCLVALVVMYIREKIKRKLPRDSINFCSIKNIHEQ